MELSILKELSIIFSLAIAVILICHRIRVPAIVGFLLTGIIAGPHGLQWVGAIHEVEVLSEIGVILLMFTIGMEFSFRSVMRIKKIVLAGGSLQVALTAALVCGVCYLLGLPANASVFVGLSASLSSTAIVLKLMQERAVMDSPHGRTALGILIFQDMAVVPMMLLLPLLAGTGHDGADPWWMLALKTAAILVGVILSARWAIPWLLFQITRTRNREIFLMAVLLICLGTAWVTSSIGLSLSLGAFMAGLVVSESEYSHQAIGSILPFRDVFTSLFFVSIGMLLDVRFLMAEPVSIIAAATGLLGIKPLITCFSVLVLGQPLRTSVLSGLAIGQVGEFAFVLAMAGVRLELLTENAYQLFLAASVLTMASTPFILSLSPRIADAVMAFHWPERFRKNDGDGPEPVSEVNHLVIIGFGVNGRNMAKAAGLAKIPFQILEMNPETVRVERAKGMPIHFGDATQEPVLRHLNVPHARVVVVAINDAAATRRITEEVRAVAPKTRLIVRTRFLGEMKPLFALGADEVIPEEFETSIEIFSRVLADYLISRDEIERFVAEVRADGYGMFRSLSTAAARDLKTCLPEIDITSVRVPARSELSGKSLADLDFRRRFGGTVVAVKRKTEIIATPGPDTRIMEDDLLFCLVAPEHQANFHRMMRHPSP